MIWVIFILIVLGVIAAIAANSNKNHSMNALALHENIKRNYPDDALAELGPHEFERAFTTAKQKRNTKISLDILLWFVIGVVVSAVPSSVLAAQHQGGLASIVSAVIVLAALWFGLKRARSKTKQVIDLMRDELKV